MKKKNLTKKKKRFTRPVVSHHGPATVYWKKIVAANARIELGEKMALNSRLERLETEHNEFNRFIQGHHGSQVVTAQRLAYIASQARYVGMSPEDAAREAMKLWQACNVVLRSMDWQNSPERQDRFG